MYSSIEEISRKEVIRKCYWPLFKLADMGIPIGIEAPAVTLEIINKWKIPEVLNVYNEAPKKGLSSIINNKTLLEWGKIFLNLAQKGLEKRSIKNNRGEDESIFLRNVKHILNNNKNKANIAIEKFKNQKNLEFLYEKE